MTISTALLERTTTTLTASRLPAEALATVVEVDTPHSYVYGQTQPLLVTRTERLRAGEVGVDLLQQSWPELHGTVQTVRGANTTHRGWVLREVSGALRNENIRVFGAPINPAMEDGHFYRIIESTVRQYIGHVIRYQPDQSIRLTMVARGDGLPVVGDDGWDTWDSDVFCYVEVRDPRLPSAPSSLEELIESDTDGLLVPEPPSFEEETVGIPTHLSEEHLPRNIRPYAVYEDNGQGAPLNPEPIVGDYYAVWWDREGQDERDAIAAVRISTEAFSRIGNINRWGFESESYDYDFNAPQGEMRWVAIKADRDPVPGDAPTTLANVLAETEQLETTFEGMLEELHAMADRKGWCQEYEEVMHRGDMPGRPRYDTPPAPERHAYDIEVRAYFEFDGNPSSTQIDREVGSVFDIEGCDVSNITLTGNKTFTIEGIVAEDESSARESLDNARVEEELNGWLEDFDCDAVTSFVITDVTEDENYDFDE